MKNHLVAIGAFVSLVSERVVQITNHTRCPNDLVRSGTSATEPWYEGVDKMGVRHAFPQAAISSSVTGFPWEPLPVSPLKVRIPRIVTRGQHRAAAKSRAGKSLGSASLRLEWPFEEVEASDGIYNLQAQRLLSFIVDKLPFGIADKALLKWLELIEEGPAAILTEPVAKALRRVGRKLKAS